MTLSEAVEENRIEIERRSNSERELEKCEGWFRDPDDLDLFWRITKRSENWMIHGHKRMGWEPVSVGGWLKDDTWVRLSEIKIL